VASRVESTSTESFQRLFDLSVDMLGTASLDGWFTSLNPAWAQALGWTNDELMAQPFMAFVHPDDVAATAVKAAELSAGDGAVVRDFENRYLTRDGEYRWIHWTVIADDALYFVARDVTARRAADVERDQAASLMTAIVENVADGLYVADAEGRLTFINPAGVELLGYDSADDLLGTAPHDTFHHTHLDGMSFPIEDCPLAQVSETGVAVHLEEDGFWRKDGSAMAVSCTAAPIKLGDATGSLVAFRDITERKANELRVRRELEALSWVGRIRDALDQDRFVLYAQPIIDLATGATIQHELLLRMIGDAGKIIAPGEFLPVAEQHGLMGEIDRRVLELAMTYAAAGHRTEINLSAESISEPGLFGFVRDTLEAARVEPRMIIFEITETALIHNEGVARVFIENARRAGCEVALDDFGTGYGSFRYLKHLPVTLLKIDQEFVRDLDDAEVEANTHVIKAIVTLARGMGQKTVAEGVETQSSVDILRELGVDYAQGYLFARPSPADTVFHTIETEP
jgi:PAS domain S-box-containing protein